MTHPVLLWIRREFRLDDNPALAAALAHQAPVILVYIPPEEGDSWVPGAASRLWLHHSLKAFDAQLHRFGSHIVFRPGPASTALPKLVSETGASAVIATRRITPRESAEQEAVALNLVDNRIRLELVEGALFFPVGSILTKKESPHKVFTPFWNSCLDRPKPSEPQPAPQHLPHPDQWPDSELLEELVPLPEHPWGNDLIGRWSPGEQGAMKALDTFLESGILHYATRRDFPAAQATSHLSPHLAFGEIGPRRIWHAVQERIRQDRHLQPGADTFLKELGWREFAHHILYHFPHTADQPLDSKFEHFPWEEDRGEFLRWKEGTTGYPIVDAGMRELWTTGWMHNRVRMIVASFLTKHLLLPWHKGARWFWDTLLDADLANNTLGWQWASGCGADAAPYFRIFNPVLQGQKFDPQGVYVREWVPELQLMDERYIHSPWEAPIEEQRRARVRIGSDYPHPVIDHKHARERALEAFQTMKMIAGQGDAPE